MSLLHGGVKMNLLLAELPMVLARRRGLGNLIEGLYNGDPMAWTITIGVVVIFVGIPVAKHFMAKNEQGEEQVPTSETVGESETP